MATQPTWIYHITHLRNLPSILEAGGLRSPTQMQRSAAAFVSVAYESVQQRRARTRVPCGPGGSLHDYVPFYFAPRSPMLYTIHQGNVPGYQDGQGSLIYLVTSVQAVHDAGLRYVFTDGHGIMALTEFFEDLANLDRIDWGVMQSRYWADTNEDNDRCRRRQAEFLVYQFFPWELVLGVAAISERMRGAVEALLASATHRPRLAVRRDWYYG